MTAAHPDLTPSVYKIDSADGQRFVIYNASALGNPADHVADKWYFLPFSAFLPVGDVVGEPFDSAEDAERAARAWHAPADRN